MNTLNCGHDAPAGGQAWWQFQNNCLTLQGDAVGAWISEKICAVVFPTPETIRKVSASMPCWPAWDTQLC